MSHHRNGNIALITEQAPHIAVVMAVINHRRIFINGLFADQATKLLYLQHFKIFSPSDAVSCADIAAFITLVAPTF